MSNSALERQARSSNELMRRLIKERDGTKLADCNVSLSSSCVVNFAQTNLQISGTSAGGMTMLNPSAQSMNHFHSRTIIHGSAPTFEMPQQTTIKIFGQGYNTPYLAFLYQTLAQPHIPPGVRVGHIEKQQWQLPSPVLHHNLHRPLPTTR
jgi:hypothetical protein